MANPKRSLLIVIVVLIASIIIALIVWVIDFGFEKFIRFIYKLIYIIYGGKNV